MRIEQATVNTVVAMSSYHTQGKGLTSDFSAEAFESQHDRYIQQATADGLNMHRRSF
jgi:hypothetical protein